MNKEINPLANPDIAPYFLKGIDLYRQIKPLQEEFANVIETQDYKKANEISQEIVKLMTEFHLLFYFRPSTIQKGLKDWRCVQKIQLTTKKLYIFISEIEKAAISVDLKKFIKFTDKAYHQMFRLLEAAKECAEEGLPTPVHHKQNLRRDGKEYKPISEVTKSRFALPEVKEQIKIRNKVMRKVYSQRARLENWKEFTKHHRRNEIDDEEIIEPIENDSQELDNLINEFEEEI